jgi:pimeloyl-ACP methyl ester carboxylesterase
MRTTLEAWLVRAIVLTAALCGLAALVEQLLERRDAINLSGDDTYCSVNGRRVRYRLVGADRPGPTIVLVSGFGGTIEQWRLVQDPLAIDAPALAYDRGGMGFSDAISSHDAATEAEELEGLLRALRITSPVVLASYSSSALMVRTFIQRHADLVSGVVFLDPMLPTNEYIGTRPLVLLTIRSLVGLMRLHELRETWRNPPATRAEEKADALFASFHHWFASAAEGMDLGNWSAKLMAMPALPAVPVGVLCTFYPSRGPANAEVFEKSRSLASKSVRGTFLPTHFNHSYLLSDLVGIPTVIDFIRQIEREARSTDPRPGSDNRAGAP